MSKVLGKVYWRDGSSIGVQLATTNTPQDIIKICYKKFEYDMTELKEKVPLNTYKLFEYTVSGEVSSLRELGAEDNLLSIQANWGANSQAAGKNKFVFLSLFGEKPTIPNWIEPSHVSTRNDNKPVPFYKPKSLRSTTSSPICLHENADSSSEHSNDIIVAPLKPIKPPKPQKEHVTLNENKQNDTEHSIDMPHNTEEYIECNKSLPKKRSNTHELQEEQKESKSKKGTIKNLRSSFKSIFTFQRKKSDTEDMKKSEFSIKGSNSEQHQSPIKVTPNLEPITPNEEIDKTKNDSNISMRKTPINSNHSKEDEVLSRSYDDSNDPIGASLYWLRLILSSSRTDITDYSSLRDGTVLCSLALTLTGQIPYLGTCKPLTDSPKQDLINNISSALTFFRSQGCNFQYTENDVYMNDANAILSILTEIRDVMFTTVKNMVQFNEIKQLKRSLIISDEKEYLAETLEVITKVLKVFKQDLSKETDIRFIAKRYLPAFASAITQHNCHCDCPLETSCSQTTTFFAFPSCTTFLFGIPGEPISPESIPQIDTKSCCIKHAINHLNLFGVLKCFSAEDITTDTSKCLKYFSITRKLFAKQIEALSEQQPKFFAPLPTAPLKFPSAPPKRNSILEKPELLPKSCEESPVSALVNERLQSLSHIIELLESEFDANDTRKAIIKYGTPPAESKPNESTDVTEEGCRAQTNINSNNGSTGKQESGNMKDTMKESEEDATTQYEKYENIMSAELFQSKSFANNF